jgi:hypothetical protein
VPNFSKICLNLTSLVLILLKDRQKLEILSFFTYINIEKMAFFIPNDTKIRKKYVGVGFFFLSSRMFRPELVGKFATLILLPDGYFRSQNEPLPQTINIRDSV